MQGTTLLQTRQCRPTIGFVLFQGILLGCRSVAQVLASAGGNFRVRQLTILLATRYCKPDYRTLEQGLLYLIKPVAKVLMSARARGVTFRQKTTQQGRQGTSHQRVGLLGFIWDTLQVQVSSLGSDVTFRPGTRLQERQGTSALTLGLDRGYFMGLQPGF